ncbi:MAG: class I SAM-dependent methyltransferase [Spirochaetes bacterium]|nr:class I SAM-dependent methyltransferase [Spirochaetota bacterium]
MSLFEIQKERDSASSARRRVQEDYYRARIQCYGIHSAGAVGWTDYLQILLFEKISLLFSSRNSSERFSVLDVGCGLGDFSRFLRDHGYRIVEYVGIDIMPEMVRLARQKYPQERFLIGDFINVTFSRKFDYAICSGALNIVCEKDYRAHENFVRCFIKKMYRLAQNGIAFNLLSREGKDFFPYDSKFYYADFNEIEAFCRTFAAKVIVHRDEKEFAFTVILRK